MRYKILAASLATAGVALGAAACSSSGSSSSSASAASSSAATSMAPSSAATSMAPSSAASGSGTSAMTDFGPACSAVPASGAGSFTGMATAPVATAASANPVLSTLVTAVKKAGLVDTLNSAKDITVFAPANSAFAKIPASTLNSVLANKAELTKLLTYHVAAGRIAPSAFASGGTAKSLEGGTVKLSMSGGTYMVNSAKVVCGNVQTANATVYIIGSVLMPK